jgi:hypothetical protein
MSEGVAAHDSLAAKGFSALFLKLSKEIPDLLVLFSGDLTRCGHCLEFGNAMRFLHYYIEQPRLGAPLYGMGANARSTFTISGNHDFFCGVPFSHPFFLNPESVSKACFWPTPWLKVVEDVDSKIDLHIVGFNTLSGFKGPMSVRFAAARGSISDFEYERASVWLEDAIAISRSKGRLTLRVVMCHHPPLTLTDSASKRFESWIERMNVSVVLTGHEHQCRTPDSLRENTPFVEFRCGTTLQKVSKRHEGNHFFVHELSCSSNSETPEVNWNVRSFWYAGMKWREHSVQEDGMPCQYQIPLLLT